MPPCEILLSGARDLRCGAIRLDANRVAEDNPSLLGIFAVFSPLRFSVELGHIFSCGC